MVIFGFIATFAIGVYLGVKWAQWSYDREIRKIFPDYAEYAEQNRP